MNTIYAPARSILLGRKHALRKLVEKNTIEEKRIQEDVEPDWPDRAVIRETAQVLERLSDAQRRELDEIDAALERIARGVYGHCETCNASIGRQRLRAIPEAKFCITCTEKLEQAL